MTRPRSRKLLVIGAGGHAQVVADAARAARAFDEIAFLSQTAREENLLNGSAVRIGVLEHARFPLAEWSVIVGIGDNRKRWALLDDARQLGYELATVVHPFSYISSNARADEGCLILAGAVVQAGARLHAGAIVNNCASIDHGCDIGPGAHVAPGAILAGDVRVGARSFIGVGAAVRNGIMIGDDVLVGAGAVVVQDLPAPGTYFGVPARRRPMGDRGD